MVFEPEAAPRDHQSFMEWYGKQTKWNEGHSYGDPAITSQRLRAWFADINELFPTLNGIFSEEQLPKDEVTASEYSIGTQIIYGCFAWSKVEDAYRAVFDLAAKHQLGFSNVSSNDEEVWLPGADGLVLAHQKQPPSLLAHLKAFFRKT